MDHHSKDIIRYRKSTRKSYTTRVWEYLENKTSSKVDLLLRFQSLPCKSIKIRICKAFKIFNLLQIMRYMEHKSTTKSM